MKNIVFQTDEVLLFEDNEISSEKNWTNVLLEETQDNYVLWVEEWNPLSDKSKHTKVSVHKTFGSAREKGLELARIANSNHLLKEIQK